jgi:hypothetical protein
MTIEIGIADTLQQERIILDGIMKILRGEKGNWLIQDASLRRTTCRFHFVVGMGRNGRGVQISVDLKAMELVLWKENWYYDGDQPPGMDDWEWLIAKVRGRHRVAVLGKIDLNDPRSLMRETLRAAIRRADKTRMPLWLY